MKKIALCGLFTALIVVGAWISIPFGQVPFTLQVLFVFLAGFLLDERHALLSTAVYLLLGALGLPVFAGFKGGAHVLVGPTGGYLFGFVVGAFLMALLSKRRKTFLGHLLVGLPGLAVIYLLGVVVLSLYVGGMEKAIAVGVLPFVWFDLLKLLIASLVATRLKKMEVFK